MIGPDTRPAARASLVPEHVCRSCGVSHKEAEMAWGKWGNRVGRRGVVRIATSAAVTGALLGRGLSVEKAAAAPGQEIVGSWMQLIEGQTSPALQTFTGDGGVIATTSEHLDRGPSHGAWIRTGDRTFLVTTHDMTVSIERRDEVVSTSIVRLEITVDEDGLSYSSDGIREDFDLSESLLRTERTTGRGSRIVPQPLD